jgi:hypothetical protein
MIFAVTIESCYPAENVGYLMKDATHNIKTGSLHFPLFIYSTDTYASKTLNRPVRLSVS